MHSFAYGRLGDTLYVFGGRKDGVHNKSGGFELNGSNRDLIIYDLKNNVAQNFSLATLDTALIDALSSSNTCYTQKGDHLVIIGGYSENSYNKFITHPDLSIINLVKLRSFISTNNQQELSESIHHIKNDTFAIAGGQLKYIDEHFYLVGGHKFNGIYNAQTTAFQQTYTERVLVFDILNLQSSPAIKFITQIRDELNFRRRDLNVSPFVTSKNKTELMTFSGVFLVNISSPFLNIASIQENGFTDISNFNQLLANYHCAKMGFYSRKNDVMHEVFFGGMAINYYHKNQLINDPLVPFVKTISCVERNANGEYSEIRLPDEMPGFLGTNSEFILLQNTPLFSEDIIDFDLLKKDTVDLGYILGGIYNYSTRLNPWQDSMVQLTQSNPYLLKIKLLPSAINQTVTPTKNKINYSIRYNSIASNNEIQLDISPKPNSIACWIVNQEGKIVQQLNTLKNSPISINTSQYISGSYRCVFLLDRNFQKSFHFLVP
ncbi:MAG: hypothetical protein HOP11_14900 [Saprospiraceae bacterium]|nr:hypothetical protein [Saprospiraceae bacterium]